MQQCRSRSFMDCICIDSQDSTHANRVVAYVLLSPKNLERVTRVCSVQAAKRGSSEERHARTVTRPQRDC